MGAAAGCGASDAAGSIRRLDAAEEAERLALGCGLMCRVFALFLERARADGLEVVKVVALVDRQEGGMEAVKAQVDAVEAIVTVADLMAVYQKGHVTSST